MFYVGSASIGAYSLEAVVTTETQNDKLAAEEVKPSLKRSASTDLPGVYSGFVFS